MNWLEEIWGQVGNYIDPAYLLTFVLFSFMVKKTFGGLLQKITKFHWKTAYSTVIVATALAIPFLLYTETSWVNILFSYALGTSLYELVFKWIEGLVTKKS